MSRSLLAAVLTVTTGVAHAESPWSEYSAAQPLRPAEQLVEAACDMTVDLRGALADVSVTQRLANPGPAALGATTELLLPEGAQLYSVVLRRDGKAADPAAVAVSEPVAVDRVANASALGADPVFVTALPARDGRDRYRVVVQPLEAEHEITLMTRWTATAQLRDGAIKLQLPGRAGTCRVDVNASAGAGVSIDRLRANAMELPRAGTFDLGAQDVTVSAVLAFKRTEPVLWTQTAKLGDGYSAQAITIVTPPVRSQTPRRALLLVDGSRSMELVGRHNVQKLVAAITGALPKDSEIEAVVFDRKPTRVFGSFKKVSSEGIAAIDNALRSHTSTNGSDTVAALALARSLAGESRMPTMVVLVTDGVIGELPLSALADALGTDSRSIDLHAIALAPGRMSAPDVDMLRAAVDRVGGSYVQVPARDVDTALADLDQWLRPAWLELAVDGTELAIPSQLRAGTGTVVTGVVRKTGKLKLRGRAEAKLAVTSTELPAGPLAPLALFAASEDMIAAEPLAKLRVQHPVVDAARSFVVLASEGKVAANRRAMVAGGGPFTRMLAVDDPKFPVEVRISNATVSGGSAIDRTTLQLLFRTHLQPAAFVCYQRALAKSPSLAGTAHFKLEIGRGELTRAEVGGLGDVTFDACLLDAAYTVTPPLPNPDYNTDDRTLVTYPLTFSVKEQKPFVLAGDADSSTPIDIDAIEGGVPASARRKVKLRPNDTATPLGGLRPSPTK